MANRFGPGARNPRVLEDHMRFVPLTPQNMRECRWCQPQFATTAQIDRDMLDVPWECVRMPGHERPVIDEECAGCEHWEPDYRF